jgi:glycosyltransferase involved in cell wall biosynthesis
MKILHVIPSLDPATGGPVMSAVRFSAAQSVLGCQVAIVSYRFPDAEIRIASELNSIPNFQNVKLEYLPPPTKTERTFVRGAHRRLGPVLRQFDLIHMHGVWDPLFYTAAGVAKKLGKPYVVTPHGSIPGRWARNGGKKSWRWRWDTGGC